MGGLNGAGATEYLRDENRGRRLLGSGDAQASQKRAKGRPAEENNPHKTSRDGAAQKRAKRKHDRGGQEVKTGGTTPPREWKGPGLR